MVEATKMPVKTETQKRDEKINMPQPWNYIDTLRHEVDRLFQDFGRELWRSPFHRPAFNVGLLGTEPAVDVVEKDNGFEITADLPGMDEKNVEVQVVHGNLTIKGEKKEETEEKKKDYYIQERRYGSFERSFSIPEGVDAEKIEASFKKGVLTIMLPKKPEAQTPAKKIAVKAA